MYTAILLASGSGTRFGGETPKQFLELGNGPLFCMPLSVFLDHEQCSGIVITLPLTHYELAVRLLSSYLETVCASVEYKSDTNSSFSLRGKHIVLCAGGGSRQESVRMALGYLGESGIGLPSEKIVLIHDGARPFIDAALIERTVDGLSQAVGAVPVVPINDSLIFTDGESDGGSGRYIDRARAYAVQTPQAFLADSLMEAHRSAANEAFSDASDDAQLIQRYSLGRIAFIAGNSANIKVTRRVDYEFARFVVSRGGKFE